MMFHRTSWCMSAVALVCVIAKPASAQTDDSDAILDNIRTQATISASDQQRIGESITRQLDKLASDIRKTPADSDKLFKVLRDRFRANFRNSNNTPAFTTQLAAQVSLIAAERLATRDQNPKVSQALAQVLLDMDRPEAITGFIAGLKSPTAVVRHVCALGLANQRRNIAADGAKLASTIQAAKDAGLAETDPVVLRTIYSALAYDGQAPQVLESYLAIFDKRLDARRGSLLAVDRAEVDAFEYWRTTANSNALNPAQKAQLAGKVAVFMRLDALRYQSSGLVFEEQDNIERRLDAEEDILVALAQDKGGKVRDVLASSSYDPKGGKSDHSAKVMEQVQKWIGNAETKQASALNEAPWNVPIGAP